jgi:hypothetical protein
MLEFKSRVRQDNRIKVEFPDGTFKEFTVINRSIGSQRKVIDLYNKFEKQKSDDPKKAFELLSQAIEVLFPGSTLDDFDGLDDRDLTDLITLVRDKVLSAPSDEDKKKESSEPT